MYKGNEAGAEGRNRERIEIKEGWRTRKRGIEISLAVDLMLLLSVLFSDL